MIGKGNLKQRLYVLLNKEVTESEYSHVVAHARGTSSTSLWHSRLGHPSISRLTALKDVLSLDFLDSVATSSCEVCPLAKQKRLSFTSHNNRTSHVFELIHADIWGPFSTTSHLGHRYFLTLVDDHSRYTWVFMPKKKSDVLHIVPEFFKLVET